MYFKKQVNRKLKKFELILILLVFILYMLFLPVFTYTIKTKECLANGDIQKAFLKTEAEYQLRKKLYGQNSIFTHLVLFDLGNMYATIGDNANAIKYYSEVYKNRPPKLYFKKYLSSYYSIYDPYFLSNSYNISGDSNALKSLYRQNKMNNFKYSVSKESLFYFLMTVKKFNEAENLLNSIIVSKDSSSAFLLEAFYFYNTDNFQRAKQILLENSNKKQTVAYELLSDILYQEKDYFDALSSINTLIDAKEKHSSGNDIGLLNLYYKRAKIYLAMQVKPKASLEFKKIVEIAEARNLPISPSIACSYAYLYNSISPRLSTLLLEQMKNNGYKMEENDIAIFCKK